VDALERFYEEVVQNLREWRESADPAPAGEVMTTPGAQPAWILAEDGTVHLH
jgi:hypothetical protein